MKKLKSEKGAITMVTLITVLFMVSFLISSYVVVANKVKTQKEILNETKKIYEPTATMEEIYNSYFSNDNVIPIHTAEQLLMIGEKQSNIDGKYYTNDENTIYVLMNDIEFSAEELGLQNDWVPIDDNANFLGTFDWNNKLIKATTLNGNIELHDGQTVVTIIAHENLNGEVTTDIITAVNQGKVETVLKETINGTKTIAVVPAGFELSTIKGEHTISGGLVITDTANEFVWIPVTEDLASSYSCTTGYNEPTEVTGTYDDSNSAYDSQATLDYLYGTDYYNYAEDFKYVEEYAEMVASVNKYNGFYIGRYETTIDENGNIGSKENTTVLTAGNILKEGTNSTTNEPYYYRWHGLYYAQKNANVSGNGENVQTAMIYGVLRDKTMDYIRTQKAAGNTTYDVDTVTESWHTESGVVNSAQANEGDVALNIWDLESNAYEWTQENYSTFSRVTHGGSYDNSYSAIIRNIYFPTLYDANIASRVALYIK